MRSKWTVILMTVVTILSLQGEADVIKYRRLKEFISSVNERRMKVMEEFEVKGVGELKWDGGLARQAKNLGCSFSAPKGRRLFFVPEYDSAAHHTFGLYDKFVEKAPDGIHDALREYNKFPHMVETLSVNQHSVGCSAFFCNCDFCNSYSAICLLGPKGTLTVEDLPFEKFAAYIEYSKPVFSFKKFIAKINENRQQDMEYHGLPPAPNLVIDGNLEKKAKSLSCTFNHPKGYRVFLMPRDNNALSFSYDKMSQFLEIAHNDVNRGIKWLGNSASFVEWLSIRQSRVGCAWKKCSFTVKSIVYKFAGICVLGQKGELKAEYLPFELKLYTRQSVVVYNFDQYVENINKEREDLKKAHGFWHYGTLRHSSSLSYWAQNLSCANVPDEHRYFYAPANEETAKYWYSQVDKFLSIAHKDVDQAIHMMPTWRQLVETIHVDQFEIGCVWKQCHFSDGSKFSAICLVGPEKGFRAQHFPYRKEPLAEEL